MSDPLTLDPTAFIDEVLDGVFGPKPSPDAGLVERLRYQAAEHGGTSLEEQAADALERLEMELKRLQPIKSPPDAGLMWLTSVGLTPEWFWTCSQRDQQTQVLRNAAAALEGKDAERDWLRKIHIDLQLQLSAAHSTIEAQAAEIDRLRSTLEGNKGRIAAAKHESQRIREAKDAEIDGEKAIANGWHKRWKAAQSTIEAQAKEIKSCESAWIDAEDRVQALYERLNHARATIEAQGKQIAAQAAKIERRR